MGRFSGKTVLITGGASGIGRAAALGFAAEEAHVFIADINETGGKEAIQVIAEQGGQASFISGDVSTAAGVKAIFDALFRQTERLDIAVNNAGTGGDYAPTAQYADEAWDQVMALNLNGVFYCMKEELRHMQENGGGAILNVSSVAGLKALPNASAYVASKHAVLGLTRTAALEYARYQVRVNAICPVFTDTPMVAKMFAADPSLEQKLKRAIPLRRYARPEEMAHAILWLCDPASAFVTGLCLPMDGGMMA